MKPSFIKLTDKDSNTVYVNPAAIAYMYTKNTMTFIQFNGDDETAKSFKETPEEILSLINGESKSFNGPSVH
jgi:hypothetical protein